MNFCYSKPNERKTLDVTVTFELYSYIIDLIRVGR